MADLKGTHITPDAEPSQDEKNLASLAHILGILGFIPPLIIWLIKKDQSRFVGENAFQAMIFTVGVIVAIVALNIVGCLIGLVPAIGWILSCVLILAVIPIAIYAIVLLIFGFQAAKAGKIFKYPFTGDLMAYPGGGTSSAPPAPPTE